MQWNIIVYENSLGAYHWLQKHRLQRMFFLVIWKKRI